MPARAAVCQRDRLSEKPSRATACRYSMPIQLVEATACQSNILPVLPARAAGCESDRLSVQQHTGDAYQFSTSELQTASATASRYSMPIHAACQSYSLPVQPARATAYQYGLPVLLVRATDCQGNSLLEQQSSSTFRQHNLAVELSSLALQSASTARQ
jgi:hypothetical protein